MNIRAHRNGLALFAAGWVAMVGCSDTEIQGVILDDDINTLELLVPLTRGSLNEWTDQVNTNFGGYWLFYGSMVDDAFNDGSSTFEQDGAIMDYSERDHGNGVWTQGHEGSWAGLLVFDRATAILGSKEAALGRPEVARGLLNHAMVEQRLGETFCASFYGYGITGGFNLFNLGPQNAFSNDEPVGRDVILGRAVTGYQTALEAAEGAIADGVGNPAGNDRLFEPELLRLAAHGGLAQSYMMLASLGFNSDANWDLAVQHAGQIQDLDFAELAVYHEDAFDNNIFEDGWQNDDYTMWGQLLPDGTVNGTPAGALFLDDPRVDVTRCGDFADGPQAEIGSTVVDNDTCNIFSRDHIAEFGRQRRGQDIPKWNANAFDDDNDDIPVITGVEMRLIEAEAALVDGDIGTFTDIINDVRDHFGADPIPEPATIGEMEWPNAEDDAMSILDRERYLSLWLQGRRFADMVRWDHPFITESLAMHPRHRERIQLRGDRFSCHPVALDECNLNERISCEIPATRQSVF